MVSWVRRRGGPLGDSKDNDGLHRTVTLDPQNPNGSVRKKGAATVAPFL
jgi:hypothetical protein